MEHVVTYTGKIFTPLRPDMNLVIIEDIAHSLSLLCCGNGHIDRFYSLAQHSMNCANEAKSRGCTARVQLACLLHEGNEAYISDSTRRVKFYMLQYKEIEEQLQGVIYTKFLGDALSKDELSEVNKIEEDMLIWELDKLYRNKMLISEYRSPLPQLLSEPSFAAKGFTDVENDFLKVYYGIMHAGLIQGR